MEKLAACLLPGAALAGQGQPGPFALASGSVYSQLDCPAQPYAGPDRRAAGPLRPLTGRRSFSINPAWQRQSQQLSQRGQQRNSAIARSRGDLLAGKTKLKNPETGQRYRLDDCYNHVYQDRNGALHGSNVPLGAGALDWQELQRVELGSY